AALALTAMNAIRRTGHCYGFALDRPQDRAYILSLLVLAGAGRPGDRQKQMVRLEELENWVSARAMESLAIDALANTFSRLACVEAVPGAGAVLGSAFNVAYIRQVLSDSRRFFQERWLRANGCLHDPYDPTGRDRASALFSHRIHRLRWFHS